MAPVEVDECGDDCQHDHGQDHGHAHGHAVGHGQDGLEPLELGQKCLSQGDPASAVVHLEEALRQPKGNTVDTRLILAEALWHSAGSKGTDKALPHYEVAAALAAADGDRGKQGMVALGHGYALMQLGRPAAAAERLAFAKKLAEEDDNPAAVRFVDRLLEQAASAMPAEGPEAVQATWRSFAETLAMDKPAVLFLRGTIAAPLDEDSWRGVTLLRAAGCVSIEAVDVSTPGDRVPEGLQAISDSEHVKLPQLYVAGTEVENWLSLKSEDLRNNLEEAGAPLGEPKIEPCHGSAAFSDGLEPWEVELVDLVSKHGTEDWSRLAAGLTEKGFSELADPSRLESEWQRLAPLVKEKLQHQTEMPCGHSCDTCPTRHDCQLHDAVGDVRDIEDLVGGGAK